MTTTLSHTDATRLDGAQRLTFLPSLFSSDFMLSELSVYAYASRYIEGYNGGFWEYYSLPDGAGFMVPDREIVTFCNPDNWFEQEVSGEVAGIIVTALALYSDRHSIFRVNNPEREGELTQFTRAIKTLGIEPIHANSPQAKGRVERANQTLQDRLVKEMRLQGINDIDTANAWLPTFIESYNKRFASPPRISDNAHLDVRHSEDELDYIFSYQAKRVLSKNLTFQYKSSAFQIRSEGRGYRLRNSAVTVCESFEGEITVLYDGKELGWEKYVDGPEPIPLDDEKSVHERVDNARIDLRSKYYVKPKADHPWLTRRTQSHEQVKPPALPKKRADVDKMK